MNFHDHVGTGEDLGQVVGRLQAAAVSRTEPLERRRLERRQAAADSHALAPGLRRAAKLVEQVGNGVCGRASISAAWVS